MARRFFAILIALAVGGWTAAAIERATFILVTGERVTGGVVFHTDSRENLIAGNLNLDMGEKELPFHLDQVVVIEFLAGTPSQSELGALPEGSRQMLVMRNGENRYGQFVNLIGGDTVRWKNESGDTQEMPIRDVSRIYLNADNARRIYNFNGPSTRSQGRGAGRGAGYANPRAGSGEIEVPAGSAWINTGIDVQAGEMVAFSVRGRISTAEGGDMTGPDGNPAVRNPAYPVGAMGSGALIGRVRNSPPFAIGGNRNPIRMPLAGRLMLGINDDVLTDNSGSYFVTITRR